MNRDDLLSLLDLSGKETVENSTSLLGKSTPQLPASPTALQLDDWSLRKGVDLLTESERLQQLNLDAHAVADFHAAAFLPDPQLTECCEDRLRHAFLRQLFETPEYHSLHETTLLRELPSSITTLSLAEQFARLKEESTEHGPQCDLDREMSTLRAVGLALTEATREVEEADEAVSGLGLGPGSPGSNDVAAVARVYRRVRSDPVLQRICTLAGRFRRVAQSRQRRKILHGVDDVVGVRLDGDLGRLLPVELAKLTLPELETDTLRRLLERQCLCREYQASEPVAKGPILVVLDESGSMQGRKIETAKALALALAWIARRQRRWCGLIAYSGQSGERLLSLPCSRWDETALAEWLCAFIGRGSSLDVPVKEMPEYYQRIGAPVGKTDLIFLTDAQVVILPELQDAFRRWKTSVQARLISVILNTHAGDLAAISDEYHLVETLTVDGSAVDRVLSL